MLHPSTFKREAEGWSRGQITGVVLRLVERSMEHQHAAPRGVEISERIPWPSE